MQHYMAMLKELLASQVANPDTKAIPFRQELTDAGGSLLIGGQ